MNGLSVVVGDPGKTDPFGIMGAQYDSFTNKIRWKLAKQFKHESYFTVAHYLKKIKETINPDFMGIETNNKGKRLLRLFHDKYNLTYIQGINMSNNLTISTRDKGYSTDKNYMIHWMKEKLDDGMFEFPDTPTKDMQEFIDQFPKIVSNVTPNGSTTYKAHRSQHDDLFMAGLHCCNVIRLFIDQQERLK